MEINEKVLSLYGHWVNCNDIFVLAPFEHPMPENMQKNIAKFANEMQSFFRLCTAYGLLYVVYEGYRDLSLSDEKIDLLTCEENYLDNLRLLRNAMFHYQKDSFNPKLMGFIQMEGSADWAKKLKYAFEQFFIKNLPIEKFIEIMERNNLDQ